MLMSTLTFLTLFAKINLGKSLRTHLKARSVSIVLSQKDVELYDFNNEIFQLPSTMSFEGIAIKSSGEEFLGYQHCH